MLKWPPLPVRSAYGFGMKVASKPYLRASSLVISRHSTKRSAIDITSVYEKSSSNWLLASSWSNEWTSQPSWFMYLMSSSRKGRFSSRPATS